MNRDDQAFNRDDHLRIFKDACRDIVLACRYIEKHVVCDS